MKVAIRLAKNVLTLLRIRAAASAIDAGIQKKKHNEEMNDIMKII